MEQFFTQWGPTSSLFWVRAIWSILTFVGMAWVAMVAQHGTARAVVRVGAAPNARLLLERIVQFGILILGAVLALAILGVDLAALTTLVGFATIAISVSFQDVLRSLLTGLYLLIERPFQVGDTIEVSGQVGVIEDIGMRTTILRNTKGDRVIIPNVSMFTSTIVQKKLMKENS